MSFHNHHNSTHGPLGYCSFMMKYKPKKVIKACLVLYRFPDSLISVVPELPAQ
jgi:hypothetical protein